MNINSFYLPTEIFISCFKYYWVIDVFGFYKNTYFLLFWVIFISSIRLRTKALISSLLGSWMLQKTSHLTLSKNSFRLSKTDLSLLAIATLFLSVFRLNSISFLNPLHSSSCFF